MRVSELYYSIQGEGPSVGLPTVFVRFAGCNMRCPGWPCDTPYAIEPEIWKEEMTTMTPVEIVTEVKRMPVMNVTLTGGEPTIQPKEELRELALLLRQEGYSVDVFTNGSRDLMQPFMHPMAHPDSQTLMSNITFILDWKLSGSGEADHFLAQRKMNFKLLTDKDAVKFVVSDFPDFSEAMEIITPWRPGVYRAPQVYFGVAWGKVTTEKDLAHWIEEARLYWVKLNVQVHKYIYDPKARRI